MTNFEWILETISKLTLGDFVVIVDHVIGKKEPGDPVEKALSQYLSQQSWGIRLLESIDKKLTRKLHSIKDIRNKCAHPGWTPNRDNIEKMLETVVTGEQAFFRYFVGAFV